MAELIIQTQKIKENIKWLSKYLEQHKIYWSLVTKVFSGDRDFLIKVLTENVIQNISSIGDSRLSSLKNLKAVNPNMRTVYIKPPAKIYAEEVIEYADISLNSSYSTIEALNREARKKDKPHQIVMMIEMGELREGINRKDVLGMYERTFQLSHIEIIGIGSNLGCMFGVEPTPEKLYELIIFKNQIANRFNKSLKYVSGGTSITLPLLEASGVPEGINHFRIGEAAFFGQSPLNNKPFKGLSPETFEFRANIIELNEKEIVPDGKLGEITVGHTIQFEKDHFQGTSVKAILDFGIIDVDKEDLESKDPNVKFVGVTSDMLVVDIGNNRLPNGLPRYKVGDKMIFKPNYMAVARLLNSKFINKKFIE